MKNQKLSCLFWGVVFLALCGGAGWFVHRRIPTTEAAFIGGAIGGVMLLILLGWLLAIPARILEWWRIALARLGTEPRDGRRVAIVGTLRSHGELYAPFSRERCVLYAYSVDCNTGKAYEGFAMVPLFIEHGTDRTRILSRPDIATLPAVVVDASHARSFLESTKFVAAPATHTDTDSLRFDHRHAEVKDLRACRLTERRLSGDTEVCVTGRYDAGRQALVAPVALRPGSAFGIAAAWRIVNACIGVAIFAAIALAVAAVFCANFPVIDSDLAWWEIDVERFVEKNVRTPLATAGVITVPGFRLQDVCDGCANGTLVVDGREVALTRARYAGGKAVHISANDRDGVTLDGNHVTLKVDGKSAPVPPSWIQPHDIETSLGANGDYHGRITIVAPDRSIRCRVTFRTRVDADAWLR